MIKDTGWRIELLGGLRALQGGRLTTRFRTQKTGALLAYLAYHRGRVHSREQLAELLWPDHPPDAGRNSLSTALWDLRARLETTEPASGPILRADRTSVALDPERVTTDAGEFEALLRTAGRHPREDDQLRALTGALELYRGELLPGVYEEWVIGERDRLEGLFYQALRQVTDRCERAGDAHGAVTHALRALALDP